MNIPLFIFGLVMIGLGVIFIKIEISSSRKREKDTLGLGMRTLVGGIGLVVIGIIVIIKSFMV
jgi:hypothetical protein